MNSKIELSENSIQILKKTDITPDSVVLVKVDTSMMSRAKADEYMKGILDVFKEKLNHVNILVIPNVIEDISVIEKTKDE